MKRTAVYALTEEGARTAETLAGRLDGDLFLPRGLSAEFEGKRFDRLIDLVSATFPRYRRHVFVAAVGIVVRVIAPHIGSKSKDPAVVALDQRGRHAVSVLSGHLGGANRLAREVADLTGGTPVITTATDTEGLPSIDLLAQENGLAIENPSAVKAVNKAILNGQPIQVYDPEDRLGLKGGESGELPFRLVAAGGDWGRSAPGVWVSWKIAEPHPQRLLLHPPVLVAGVGCNRGTEAKEVLALVRETFLAHSLSLMSLQCLSTIEEKRGEEGLVEAARALKVPLLFFESKRLMTVEVPNPSSTVQRHMGVSSVCEAAALLKSGARDLLVPKTKSRNVTLAIALQA
jgi:cobalt-precorrin 5A hydrolase